MSILLVFIFFTIATFIFFSNINLKLYIKIKEDHIVSYLKICFRDITLIKFQIRKLAKNIRGKGSYKSQQYLVLREILKQRYLQFEKFNLKVDISAADSIVTSYIVAAISTLITLVIAFSKINIKDAEYKYVVNPIYINKKLLNIRLDCIIKISLVHIICILIKEWRRDINGRRAPNRKPYDNCNEQHKRDDRRKYNNWWTDKGTK